jgi:hypothetical protein
MWVSDTLRQVAMNSGCYTSPTNGSRTIDPLTDGWLRVGCDSCHVPMWSTVGTGCREPIVESAMKTIQALALATTLSLVGLACGSDSTPTTTDVTTPPVVTNPPETDPPGSTPPGSTPPGTTPPDTEPPTADPELPPRPIDIDDGAFETIGDLGEGAELIVVGTVTGEESLGQPLATNDPSSDEYLGLTISIDSVLKGGPLDEVLLAWDAYVVDANGARVAANVMNGIPVPHVGDQLVLFLRPVDDQFASLLHGFPTHTPVALDGVGFVEANTISISDTTARDAAHLEGMTIDEVAAQV